MTRGAASGSTFSRSFRCASRYRDELAGLSRRPPARAPGSFSRRSYNSPSADTTNRTGCRGSSCRDRPAPAPRARTDQVMVETGQPVEGNHRRRRRRELLGQGAQRRQHGRHLYAEHRIQLARRRSPSTSNLHLQRLKGLRCSWIGGDHLGQHVAHRGFPVRPVRSRHQLGQAQLACRGPRVTAETRLRTPRAPSSHRPRGQAFPEPRPTETRLRRRQWNPGNSTMICREIGQRRLELIARDLRSRGLEPLRRIVPRR